MSQPGTLVVSSCNLPCCPSDLRENDCASKRQLACPFDSKSHSELSAMSKKTARQSLVKAQARPGLFQFITHMLLAQAWMNLHRYPPRHEREHFPHIPAEGTVTETRGKALVGTNTCLHLHVSCVCYDWPKSLLWIRW